jgi:hypothetical protein
MSYGTVTIPSGTSVLVIAYNDKRKSLILTNEGSSKVYIGSDSFVTSATGISIESDGKYTEDSGGTRTYLGDVYAISQDSTNDLRYWEKV